MWWPPHAARGGLLSNGFSTDLLDNKATPLASKKKNYPPIVSQKVSFDRLLSSWMNREREEIRHKHNIETR